jgi:hypothetical protein
MSLHIYPVLASIPSNPPEGVRLLYVLATDNHLYYHNSSGYVDLTAGGGLVAHDLGGAFHNADTLANLNNKISDATLDTNTAPRDPNAHALGGAAHSADSLANLNSKVTDGNLDLDTDSRPPNLHGESAHTGTIGAASQISDFATTALLRADDDWSAFTSEPSPADTMILLGERGGDGAKRRFTKAQLLAGVSGGMPGGYVDGLPAIWVSDSTLRIGPGRCRSDDNTTDIVVSSNLDAAFGTTGAGGLDAGSEASSTGYYLWLIYDPTGDTEAAMLSTSSTAPTMPGDYTKKRLIGYGFNNASSNFWEFKQNGDGRTRLVMYNEPRSPTLRVLDAGTSTGWANVDFSEFVPVNATSALIMAQNNGTNTAYVRPDNFTAVSSGLVFVVADLSYQMEMLMVDTQIVEYSVLSGGTLTLDVMGYRLRL